MPHTKEICVSLQTLGFGDGGSLVTGNAKTSSKSLIMEGGEKITELSPMRDLL